MSIEKVKAWTKKHWKKLAVVGGLALGGTLAYFGGKKSGTKVIQQIGTALAPYEKLEIPESLKPFVREIGSSDPESYVDIWYKNIRYEDLAKFGEAMKESFPDTQAIGAYVLNPITVDDLT